MIRILLSGASGRLCSTIGRMAADRDDIEILGGIDLQPAAGSPYPIWQDYSELPAVPDVIIDCSHHTAVSKLLDYAKTNHVPAVICTTGHTEEETALIHDAADVIPVLHSRNMSLGINLLSELVKKTAMVLGQEYDIEILEMHHNKKLDAPSGTALMLAEAAAEGRDGESEFVYDRHAVRKAREKKEIGISSIRGGTIVGEHEVIFAGTDEVIKLSHSAGSRDLFAVGAIKAALYLADRQPGFYTMADVCRDML